MAKTILVTDDDSMSLKMAEMVLKKGGYEVLKASSGKECISIAKENTDGIGLILLDKEMPEMDGFETLRELKADSDTKDITVLMLTGTIDDEIEEEARATGAEGCVGKPFVPAKLLGEVGMYI